MDDYTRQHKKAWEYDAYEFWVRTAGTPEERARKDRENPKGMLKRYAGYFDSYDGIKVANICGSCGKKAIPLALLGSDVTVFDISEENKRYAMQVAEAAGVSIGFEVCDILEIDMERYAGRFDDAFMEGGVLHYFHDIAAFMQVMNEILRPGGKLICIYRKYTISEIINSIIGSSFTLTCFDEHPSWENEKLPGEFTAVAVKNSMGVK